VAVNDPAFQSRMAQGRRARRAVEWRVIFWEFDMSTSAAAKENKADKDDKSGSAAATRFAKDQLKAIIERVERLEEEKKTISDDIRDVYAEAKANGFDVKALRTIVRLRKQDSDERREHEAILETYMHALGMIA
jgi:uncharacterized protein (UPF0335 family)